MEAAKHTPGPWFRSGVRQKVGGSDTHSIVATVDGKEIIVASVWYDPKTHEGFHDARLIAAAPDLLSTLRRVERGLSYACIGAGILSELQADLEAVRAAIAKATAHQHEKKEG